MTTLAKSTATEPKASETSALETRPAPLRPLAPAPLRPLAVGRMKVIRASETTYGNLLGAVLPTGTPLDKVLIPQFWSLVAVLLHAGDQIEIHWDDGSGFARLFVREVGGSGGVKTWARGVILESYEWGALEPLRSVRTHEVRHQGPHLKWTVVRLADGHTVADSFETPTAAEAAIAAIVRKSAAPPAASS